MSSQLVKHLEDLHRTQNEAGDNQDESRDKGTALLLQLGPGVLRPAGPSVSQIQPRHLLGNPG